MILLSLILVINILVQISHQAVLRRVCINDGGNHCNEVLRHEQKSALLDTERISNKVPTRDQVNINKVKLRSGTDPLLTYSDSYEEELKRIDLQNRKEKLAKFRIKGKLRPGKNKKTRPKPKPETKDKKRKKPSKPKFELEAEVEFNIGKKADSPESDEDESLEYQTLSKMTQGPVVILLSHRKNK